MTFIRTALVAGSIATIINAQAFAASQGNVGATSSGTSTISVTVPALARITAIDDIAFGTWTGTGPLSSTDDVCIWTSNTGYSITASGSGTGGAFEMTDGTNTVPYTVKWDDVAGSSSGTSLTSGSALAGQTSSATSTNCNGGSALTATLGIDVTESSLASAPVGTFTGTLTLLVAAE